MKVMMMVQLFPAASDLGQRLTAKNSFESPPRTIDKRGSVIVIAVFPVLVTVMFLVLSEPK